VNQSVEATRLGVLQYLASRSDSRRIRGPQAQRLEYSQGHLVFLADAPVQDPAQPPCIRLLPASNLLLRSPPDGSGIYSWVWLGHLPAVAGVSELASEIPAVCMVLGVNHGPAPKFPSDPTERL